MSRLLVATRSADKLMEIRELLRVVPELELTDPDGAGVPASPEEDAIEEHSTFRENALAKAEYFHARTAMLTVADDSGLEVDALQGRPGVHSKRFAPAGAELGGGELDRANNEHLLALLGDLELAQRTARYVCVAALVGGPGGPRFFRGEVEGLILGRPRGRGGFGYDPLFFHPGLGRTFAEVDRRAKSQLSHRGKVFRLLADHLGSRAAEAG